jgi:hypothetical protein
MHNRPPQTSQAPAQSAVRIVQSAEMNGLTGTKAVFMTNAIVFMSLTPETSSEAQSINQAIQKLGGVE